MRSDQQPLLAVLVGFGLRSRRAYAFFETFRGALLAPSQALCIQAVGDGAKLCDLDIYRGVCCPGLVELFPLSITEVVRERSGDQFPSPRRCFRCQARPTLFFYGNSPSMKYSGFRKFQISIEVPGHGSRRIFASGCAVEVDQSLRCSGRGPSFREVRSDRARDVRRAFCAHPETSACASGRCETSPGDRTPGVITGKPAVRVRLDVVTRHSGST